MPTPGYNQAYNDFLRNFNGGVKAGRATTQPVNPTFNAMNAGGNQMARAAGTNSSYYDDFANSINGQYDSAIGNLDKLQEADKKQLAQQYEQYRNQASASAAKNQMALREQMAAQGLFKSGDNITASTQINNQRSADINQANLGESNSYAKLQQEKYRQMMEMEMARQNALREALSKSKEWDYRDNRDSIEDDRYNKQWEYNTGRDKLEDERWDKQWNYNVDRDKIADNRWQQEWNYNVGRDQIEDDRYSSEWDYKKQQDALNQSNWERQFAKTGSRGGGGGYSSSGYGSGSTKDNVWGEFANQFANGVPANANMWLGQNKNDIIDAVGSTEYNKMKDVVIDQQKKYNNDNKRKNDKKYQVY